MTAVYIETTIPSFLPHRAQRHAITGTCGDDLKKVFEYYRQHQDESKRLGKYRFVNTPLQNVTAAQATEPTDEREPE